MIPEFGHFFLILAFVIVTVQSASLLVPKLHALLKMGALLQCLTISLSFACLILSYAESDFSVLNVSVNSHSMKPMIYKISASWGNHEGSMILWILVLSAYGLWLAVRQTPETLKGLQHTGLGMQALLQMGFIAFILFTSNPFLRLLPIPLDGKGLNPLLQDVGLALHPPLLYAGYVGFGIVFALGVAMLLAGRADKESARYVHPFILLPWIFLSLGIGMGSWWAYRELGWGGWWFWDPVENASLLPWLAGTALFHANLAFMKQGKLKAWVVLLAIITFSLSMIGTFLVRSGIVTSVHSFVSDPERGVFILGFLGLVTGGSLALYAMRAHTLSGEKEDEAAAPLQILSREGSLVINGLFLVTATASVLLATVYPIAQELMGARTVTVGAPYFNKTFFPLLAPLMLLGGLTLFLPWGNTLKGRALWRKMRHPLAATIAASLTSYIIVDTYSAWLFIGAALGFWLIATSAWMLWRNLRSSDAPFFSQMHRLFFASKSTLAVAISHGGVGLFILALTFSSQLETKQTLNMEHGTSAPSASGGTIAYQSYDERLIDNYISRTATLSLTSPDGSPHLTLAPEKRFYPTHKRETAEAAIHTHLLTGTDTYAAIRALGTGNTPTLSVEIFHTPFMLWLWLAMLIISGGGMIAFWHRLR